VEGPWNEKSGVKDVISVPVFRVSKVPKWGCSGLEGIFSSGRVKGNRLLRDGSCDAPLAVACAVHERRDERAQDLRSV
jgi:hypothetical protein